MTRAVVWFVIGIGSIWCDPSLSAQTLAPGQADDVILAVGGVVERAYFDAAVGADVKESLREGLAEGRFPNLVTAQDVVEAVNHELRFLTHDDRLALTVTPAAATDEATNATPATGGGIERSVLLPGNIGYLQVTRFVPDRQGDEARAAAMRVLRGADAVIVDLRTNDGGVPAALAATLEYFLSDAGVPLFDVESRRVEHYATSRIPPDANGRRPMYVLMSAQTSPAGSCFARVLEEQQRAELLGEPGVNAAVVDSHDRHRIGDLFQLVVPAMNMTTARGHQSCSAGGNTTDVTAPPADLLRAAQQRALRRLLSAGPNAAAREALEQALAALDGR